MAEDQFQRWIDFFFDLKYEEAEDSFGEWRYSNWLHELKEQTVFEYTIATFENKNGCLANFSDKQLYYGLQNILNLWTSGSYNFCSDIRNRIIESMSTLFTSTFVERCALGLSHNEEVCNYANMICYMWWDIAWYSPLPFDEERYPDASKKCIDVMAKILDIEHIACQESALHGLGHWHKNLPDLVTSVVDRFIDTHPHLSEALKQYAENAKIGHML